MGKVHEEQYINDTVWRLTQQDFRATIEDMYPLLSSGEVDRLIDLAYRRFSIDDWSAYVSDFVSTHVEDIKD